MDTGQKQISTQLANVLPPFVWPLLDGQSLADCQSIPIAGLLRSTNTIIGIIYGISSAGINQLYEVFRYIAGFQCKLVLAVSPACATGSSELESLHELEKQCGGSVGFRVFALDPYDAKPMSALFCLSSDYPDGLIIAGPSVDLGDHQVSAAEVNFGWRCDPILRDNFCRWFDNLWMQSSPLTASTIAIPLLVPARGSLDAARLWKQYLDSCRVESEPAIATIQAQISVICQGAPSQSGTTVSQQTVTAAMGIPQLDPLATQIQQKIDLGWQVTINKHSRIPPFDAPLKPEWFGVQSVRQSGMVSRHTQYRISVLDKENLKVIENKRTMIRTLLDQFSFPLNDGLRWMTYTAHNLFEAERLRVNREGQHLLNQLFAGDSARFIDSQRERIRKDAENMYQDLKKGQTLPASTLEKIISELKKRAKAVGKGDFLPEIERTPIQFTSGSCSADGFATNWGQAFTLLLGAAEYMRKAVYSPSFLMKLTVNKEELLEAVNVFDDSILWTPRRTRARAKEELDFLSELEEMPIDLKPKCQAILSLIEGVDMEEVRKEIRKNLFDTA